MGRVRQPSFVVNGRRYRVPRHLTQEEIALVSEITGIAELTSERYEAGVVDEGSPVLAAAVFVAMRRRDRNLTWEEFAPDGVVTVECEG